MTQSEERLRVDRQQEPTDKVRLRDHVVIEYVTTTVPVRREQQRVEHVPLDLGDSGRLLGDAPDTGGNATEKGTIVYAERPVVTTETVPLERVRLGKQTVTEQQTVSGRFSSVAVNQQGTCCRRSGQLPADCPGHRGACALRRGDRRHRTITASAEAG